MRIHVSRSLLASAGLMASLAVLASTFSPIPACAQAPAPAVANDDATIVASRQAFEALPEAERKAIQEALIWVVAYNATTGGTFGRQTYNGIVAYQKMTGAPADGILAPQTNTALMRAAASARNTAGFKVVRDDKTGIELGVPSRILVKQSVTPNGRRWQSQDDKITLDTKRAEGSAAEMQVLYDKSIAAVPGRKVTYKFLRPDFFVVTGETASGEFYIRYALGQDGLRGFTFGYDKSVKADATRLMIAVANSFVPFPETTPRSPPATQAGTPSAAMPLRVVADAAKTATGIRVGPRQVVTIGLSCAMPVVGGTPARVVKQSGELTLLELSTDTPVTVLPPRTGPVVAGTGLVMVSWDASARAVAVTSGSGEDADAVTVALQAGGRGGLVFDRTGAVAGMVGTAKSPLRSLSGVAMPSRYGLVSVKAIQDFVGGAGAFSGEPTATSAQAAGTIAASGASRLTDVVCP